MLDQIERDQQLAQAEAADAIASKFGPEWIYENENGNPAIDKRVLRAFRNLSGDAVVWDRWDFCWRKRQAGDSPGRKQE